MKFGQLLNVLPIYQRINVCDKNEPNHIIGRLTMLENSAIVTFGSDRKVVKLRDIESVIGRDSGKRVMNVSEERKITAGTISGATFKSIDIEPSIIVDGKSYTASEFNKAVEMLKQPQLNENQQQVLGWLKDYYKENRPFTTAFGAIRNVASKRWVFIKQNLTENQQEHVLEVFSRWALEQEEE